MPKKAKQESQPSGSFLNWTLFLWKDSLKLMLPKRIQIFKTQVASLGGRVVVLEHSNEDELKAARLNEGISVAVLPESKPESFPEGLAARCTYRLPESWVVKSLASGQRAPWDVGSFQERTKKQERKRKSSTSLTNSQSKKDPYDFTHLPCAADANVERKLQERMLRMKYPVDSPNQKLADAFQDLGNYKDFRGGDFPNAYFNLAASLRAFPVKIDNVELVRRLHKNHVLPALGSKMVDRLIQMVKGDFSEVELMNQDERYSACKELASIAHVGNATAQKWYARGIRSLEDVKHEAEAGTLNLTPQQRFGLEHIDDLKRRIPREDVKAVFELVEREAKNLDPGVECICVGGYRRGKHSSHDVDVVLTKRDPDPAKSYQGIVHRLETRLREKGYLPHLPLNVYGSHSRTQDSDGLEKSLTFFHSTQIFEGRWLRLDLIGAPYDRLGAVLIGWTGSATFERILRLYVKTLRPEKTKSLSNAGLAINGKLWTSSKEEDFFHQLGLSYIEPEMRNM